MVLGKKLVILGIAFVAAVMAIIVLLAGTWTNQKEFRLIPKPKAAQGGVSRVGGTTVGTGWSASDDPVTAVREAMDMALGGQPTASADFVILFASAGSDAQAILTEARRRLGAEVKIYGGTSDSRGVMTDRGYIRVSTRGYGIAAMESKHGLTVMAITSQEILFGVGSVNYADYPSVQEAGKAAVTQAMASAGKTAALRPRAVLTSPTLGGEEAVIRRAAMIHDIGKIGVPDSILRKPGPLSEGERRIMEQHPLVGVRILDQMRSLEREIPIVRHHHERWDGRGYPDNISGEAIPVGARILAVADALDAITSQRIYRASRPLSDALQVLIEDAGRQFAPEVVDALLEWVRTISHDLGGHIDLTTADLLSTPAVQD
jgi:putative nucleotidyltransferase with HDIG domain